jgi:hypothetical protein
MPDIDAFALKTPEERGGEYVRRLVRDLGLTIEQAAGLVGNLLYESGGFAKLQEVHPLIPGSRGGFGVAQWTGRRREAFEDYARKHGLSVNTDACNYGFLITEIRGLTSFYARLRAARDLAEACHITHVSYECPSDALDGSYRSGPDRLKWAQRALAGAQAAAPAPGAPTAPAPPRQAGPAADDVYRDLVAAAVEVLQRLLRETGDYDGKIDRLWGPQSHQAAVGFQKRISQC